MVLPKFQPINERISPNTTQSHNIVLIHKCVQVVLSCWELGETKLKGDKNRK